MEGQETRRRRRLSVRQADVDGSSSFLRGNTKHYIRWVRHERWATEHYAARTDVSARSTCFTTRPISSKKENAYWPGDSRTLNNSWLESTAKTSFPRITSRSSLKGLRVPSLRKYWITRRRACVEIPADRSSRAVRSAIRSSKVYRRSDPITLESRP